MSSMSTPISKYVHVHFSFASRFYVYYYFSFCGVYLCCSLKDQGCPSMLIWAKAKAERESASLASLHCFLLLVQPAATPGKCLAGTDTVLKEPKPNAKKGYKSSVVASMLASQSHLKFMRGIAQTLTGQQQQQQQNKVATLIC